MRMTIKKERNKLNHKNNQLNNNNENVTNQNTKISPLINNLILPRLNMIQFKN
jgi:hypothetical protein